MKNELKAQILESLSNKLSSIGIPVEDLKLKKTDSSIKVIPLGYLDLVKFKENFPELRTDLFHHIELSGVNRNTEYIITYKSSEDDIIEEFRKIEKQIDDSIETTLNNTLEELLKKEFGSFEDRVPEKIRSNYQMSGDFGSVKSWKALVYLANSCGDGDAQEGEMGEVGYTMIEVDTGEIIPIARSDEHHMGYDLIHHLTSKKLIPKGNYYPIFFNSNYVYQEHPDEVQKALKAFKIWRANGGENTSITATGSRSNDFTVNMDDYINANGNIEIPTGELLPIGKRVVHYLEKCAHIVSGYHQGKKVKEGHLVVYAERIVKELYETHKFFSEVKKLDFAVKIYNQDQDFSKLEQALFAHNGFKNEIHMMIRKAVKSDDYWDKRELLPIFGDIQFAEREFNRLGLI